LSLETLPSKEEEDAAAR
jgi:hypothetical protein